MPAIKFPSPPCLVGVVYGYGGNTHRGDVNNPLNMLGNTI